MNNESGYTLGKQERVIKGGPWNRFFNPIVVEVFSDYYKQGGYLFGLTGDLDNLGVYVARNGRSKAENLVDLYNQTIRNFLENWAVVNKNSLISMAFVPSGEEVLIVGAAKDEIVSTRLFAQIRDGVMSLMINQPFLDIGDTAASFGGKIFGKEYNFKVGQLIVAVEEGKSDEEVFPIYLDILSEIRREMAIELDRQKFKDVLDGNYPIEMRQLVLARMLLYKRTTKQIIGSLNQLSKAEITSLLQLLGGIYGIGFGQEDDVDHFLNVVNASKKS